MKSKTWFWTVYVVATVVLAGVASTSAQDSRPVRFSGVINDYTPASVNPTGPWEIRGPWSLRLREDGTADFSAALTMELSDFSQTTASVNAPGARGQHTHHLTVDGGTVTTLAGDGIEVTGPVTITKNGGPAPLAASTLVIDITGGTLVTYSNITLTFQGGTTSATMHFGPNAIHGVVRNVKYSDRGDSH